MRGGEEIELNRKGEEGLVEKKMLCFLFNQEFVKRDPTHWMKMIKESNNRNKH